MHSYYVRKYVFISIASFLSLLPLPPPPGRQSVCGIRLKGERSEGRSLVGRSPVRPKHREGGIRERRKVCTQGLRLSHTPRLTAPRCCTHHFFLPYSARQILTARRVERSTILLFFGGGLREGKVAKSRGGGGKGGCTRGVWLRESS